MKENSKVSVIIATYNTEHYIRQCLDSVINQTFKDMEIIVINDGSTDSSIDIINEYKQKDERVKVINLDRNYGISKVRNKGVEYSKGKYIAFIDSDDWVSKDYIEFLYENIEKEKADMVSTSFYFYNDITKEYKEHKISQFCCSSDFSTIKTKQKLLSIPSYEFMLGNKIYSRKFLMEKNLKFNMYNREDVLLNYEVFLLANKLKFINNPIYFYRKNREGSLTSTKYMLRVTVKLAEKIMEILSEKKLIALYGSSYIKFCFLYIASEIIDTRLSGKRVNRLLKNLRKKLQRKYKTFSHKLLFNSFLFFLKHRLIYYCFSILMRFVYRTVIKQR